MKNTKQANSIDHLTVINVCDWHQHGLFDYKCIRFFLNHAMGMMTSTAGLFAELRAAKCGRHAQRTAARHERLEGLCLI